jgi:hypothetical protein
MVINATFADNIKTDPSAAVIENTINQAIQIYESDIADPITVNITFQEMSGGLGENFTYYVPEDYSSYLSALQAAQTGAADATALANLPAGTVNPVNNHSMIDIRSPLARALGFSDASNGNIPMDSTISLDTAICNLTRPDTDPDKSDLLAVTLHEMDEALGGGSSLDGLAQGAPAPQDISPLDLFRFSAPGVRSYNTNAPTNNPAQAYFSIDGGVTDLVNFNQYYGGDFGDWYSYPHGPNTPPGSQVQDAFLTVGQAPDLGVELTRLDVLGFTLANGAGTPVITASSANLAANATTLIIQGTGFSSNRASDVVKFSGEVAGKVIKATPTQLTVANLTGLAVGSLTATVTVRGVSSDQQQVATVVPVVRPGKSTLGVGASTVVIHGYGFSSTAANDLVQFSDGATGNVTQATATTLVVTGLSGALAGSLAVIVTNNGVASAAYVQVAIVPITAPTLAASAASPTQVNLSWSAVAGATSYKVEQLRPNLTWAVIDTLDGNTTNQAVSVLPASTHTFRIGATDAFATAWSAPRNVTSFTLAPTVTDATLAATQVTLSWNSLSGATSYLVQEQQANNTYKTLYAVNSKTTQKTFIAPAGGTNNFQVLPVGVHGTLNVTTDSTNVVLITLSWNAVPRAVKYEVDQQQPDGSWLKLYTLGRHTHRQVVVVQPGNTYEFRVGAIDAAGAEFSDNVLVTV